MSNTEFTFFPAVRAGYRPDEAFSKGTPDLTDPGLTDVSLDVTGTGPEGTTTKSAGVDLKIYGPGEVTGLDTDQVVRMEPEPETTNFPPNYFPLVEFDTASLPWLFSPERADGAGRNRPWMTLVVVEVAATTFEPAGTGPLPVLETPTDQLPDASESWAWAHAQIVGDHDPASTFGTRSTKTVSRLLCPRNLTPETKYRACVVPTFEPGRRAGLGLEPYPEGDSSISLAWSDESSVRLPVYHSWVFTSSAEGDFESLARALDPTEFGPDIGFRSIDVSNPGPERLKLPFEAATDTGTVGIGGALKSIGAEADTYDETMRADLRNLLNTPDDVIEQTDYGAVGPPLYGQWHAGVSELEPASVDSELYYYPQWFNTLNADPRNRIASGYGTLVVQDHQERLMASAWEQFGDLREANKYLRRVQLAERILAKRHEDVASLSTGSLLGFSSPVHPYLFDETEQQTLHGIGLETDLPTALSSTAFRRVTRATGPIARRDGVTLDTTNFATRLETGRLPRLTDGLDFSVEPPTQGVDAADESTVDTFGIDPEALAQASGDAPRSPARGAVDLPSLGELESVEGLGGGQPTTPMDGSLPAGGPTTDGQDPDVEQALTALDGLDSHVGTVDRLVMDLSAAVTGDDTDRVHEIATQTPTILDHAESIGRNTFGPLSRSIAKVLTEPRPETLSAGFDRTSANGRLRDLHQAQRRLESTLQAALDGIRDEQPPGEIERRLDRAEDALAQLSRSSEALRSGLVASPMEMQAMSLSMSERDDVEIDLSSTPTIGTSRPTVDNMPSKEQLRESILSGIDPSVQLPETAGEVLGVPDLNVREDPVESVLAAPSFTDTTYELLADLNQEYFLPGIGSIPRDSIGVLQTNPEFIEAFMTGLNHEFSRELQWRRYPTDRKGTYFRRFWNRKGNPDLDPDDPEDMADIDPIHTWDENDLGQNNPHGDYAKVVLLIRGELLRRYPNTDIFVAKAVEDDDDRVPALPNTHVTRENTDADDVKFPVFRGQLDPDITFFGFDLTPEEALYDPYHAESEPDPDDHPDEGWFFVLQEPPAETRFGMDVGTEADVGTTPPGFRTDDSGPQKASEPPEHGWDALSWAHLVAEGKSPDGIDHVDVDGSRPGQEGWRITAEDTWLTDPADDQHYTDGDAATWGHNSAHMARATWQRPVRISIHADDMIPEEPPTDETDWRNVQLDLPATTVYTGGDQ